MPQMVEIPGLSQQDAEQRAEDLGIDAETVEVVPQTDGTFTVRATYSDDIEIPGAPPLPANPPANAGPAPPAAAVDGLTLSPKGAALIKAFESCLKPVAGGYQAYADPIGVLTIGWGHTNDNGRHFAANDVWTRGDCDSEFMKDISIFEKAVRRNVSVDLNQDQFDALVSFTFNVGEGNLKLSTLLKKVNARDFAGAAAEFARWNKADGKPLPGLSRRRASEALLFRSIADSNYDGVPDQ